MIDRHCGPALSLAAMLTDKPSIAVLPVQNMSGDPEQEYFADGMAMDDGLLVEFASVVDAVCCAVRVQRGMALRNADLTVDRRIEFRIGAWRRSGHDTEQPFHVPDHAGVIDPRHAARNGKSPVM